MDDLLGANDEKMTNSASPTLRAQNNVRVHDQHERPVFQGDERQRKKTKIEDGYEKSLLEPLVGTSASFTTLVTPALNNNPSNHHADLMGLNELIRLRQSQQGFQQPDSGPSRSEGQQGLHQLQQLQQQLDTTNQKSQEVLMSSNGGYQVYAGTASNHQEAGDPSPLPQPRPLRPMTERTLHGTSPPRASFQAPNHKETIPQQEQEQTQILQSQLASLKHADSLLPSPIMPQGLQLSLNAMNQGPLINVNNGVQPTPPFATSLLNSNFATSMGVAAVYPTNNAATAVLPVPLRETLVGSSKVTGKKPITLYMGCDDDSLSPYQCLVRKHIEIFEADQNEVDGNAKGRNKPIVLGQVGIRCKHCSTMPAKHRGRGSKYYPAKLSGLYQAAQSMASGHLCNHCTQIPQALRSELLILREKKSSAGGGKKYWADGVRVLGVVEDEHGLRFNKNKKPF